MVEPVPFVGVQEPESDEPVTYSAFITFGVSLESAYAGLITSNAAVSAVEGLEEVLDEFPDEGVTLRGIYDVTLGNVLDPGVCVWVRAAEADNLQWAYRQLRRVFAQCFGAAPVTADLVLELTEPEPEPGAWIGIIDAVGSGAVATIEQTGLTAVETYSEGSEEDGDAVTGDAEAAAAVSLHARLGIGLDTYTIVAEADAPQWLWGDPTEPFEEELALTGTPPLTGRWITPAEVLEVLQ